MTNSKTKVPSTPTSTVVLAVLSCLLVVHWFLPTLVTTYKICWEDDDYSHGVLLPFLSAYFIWNERKKIQALFLVPTQRSAIPIGSFWLIIGMMVFFLGSVSQLLYFQWLAFFVVLTGLSYLLFGGAVSRLLLPMVLLNFMAKPIPDALVPQLFGPLQQLAARVSAWSLELLNVPVYLSGNIIEIPGMQLMVEEACSGLRSMMALLTVSIIVFMSVPMVWWGRILVFLFSIFTAIFLNVVRVAATGIMAHFVDPSTAAGFFHTFSGMVVFFAGLVIVYLFGETIARNFPSAKKPLTSATED